MAAVTSTKFTRNKPLSTGIHYHYYVTSPNAEHFFDEPYPKTYLEKLPSNMFEQPAALPKLTNQTLRSRHNQRFRTQPITLTEICETDEENKIESDNKKESKMLGNNDYDRFEHLALAENSRYSARKKTPLKNFLKQQRLKTTQEELIETDGS